MDSNISHRGGGGGLNAFYWYQICALDPAVVEVLVWKPSNYCNVSSWRNTLIKLAHYDETKERAHNSQIVRAKENLKLSHGGSSYRYMKARF